MAPYETLSLDALPSMRRHQLLSEFAGLKQACPEGVFVSLTPGDASLWMGALFVRKGPYAPAVLRFQMSFPDSYPKLPPLITFFTDMFHPLMTPLTTYMYTTDIQDNGTVSARDEERLPPGGFSLRHGFPEWFGRGRRALSGSRQTSSEQARGAGSAQASRAPSSSCSRESETESLLSHMRAGKRGVSVYHILSYVRSTLDEADVLDSIPEEAAGNPGAWHAWRTHRRKLGKLREDGAAAAGSLERREAGHVGRRPGEWNWDGVWEDRVKKGIAASLSEPVLYGGYGVPDQVIRFLALDGTDVASMTEKLRRTLDSAA